MVLLELAQEDVCVCMCVSGCCLTFQLYVFKGKFPDLLFVDLQEETLRSGLSSVVQQPGLPIFRQCLSRKLFITTKALSRTPCYLSVPFWASFPALSRSAPVPSPAQTSGSRPEPLWAPIQRLGSLPTPSARGNTLSPTQQVPLRELIRGRCT